MLAALVLMQMAACPHVAGGPQGGQNAPDAGRSTRRVIHHFDFDERSAGNLEELPRYWTALHGQQFPRFSRGSFDETIGRTAPPSFRLQSNGRNAVFQYDGPEIPVRPDSEYRIEGFVRTRGIGAARVCVSAHFLDAQRRPLPATSQRTPYFGQPSQAEWAVFELQIPAAPAGAEFLGLAAWILQDATWNPEPVGPRISLVDVKAEAWLDDISVYRLPRVEIGTRSAGNILDQADAALWVTLADSLDPQLAAELTIVSGDGTEVLRRRLHGVEGNADVRRIEVAHLHPGLYDARIEAVDQGRTIVSRSVQFLIHGPQVRGAKRQARAFGVVIDAEDRADLQTEAALLSNHTSRSVKLPINPAQAQRQWNGGGREFEQYYNDLVRSQFSLTAVLPGPAVKPPSGSHVWQAEVGTGRTDDSDAWESEFAAMAAPAASVFRFWQIGPDGRSALGEAARFEQAAGRVRSALQKFMTAPRIAMPILALDDMSDSLPIEQLTLAVNNSADLWEFSQRVKSLKENGYEEVAAFVPSLPANRFARVPRLAEWARRVLEARHAGADVVYFPQPWGRRSQSQGGAIEPDEEYLISRTIGAMLGDASPGAIVRVAEHVRCLTFVEGHQAIVAMWDEASPPGGRTVALQLGTAGRQVDLWGNSTPLRRDESGRHLVKISATPVLIDQADLTAIDLATSFSLEPAVVESGMELVRHEIVIDCRAAVSMSGEGTIVPPRGVEISPRAFSFTARAGEPVRIPVQVRYAHNEPAGRKNFTAKITLANPAYHFEIPMTVDVGMSNVEVSGRARVERGDLLLRHTLHNQSQSVISFRSIAGVPGRQRQYRPVSNLAPGETQSVEYRFPDAGNLIGRRVNLTLRELNDGPRQHNLELVVP